MSIPIGFGGKNASKWKTILLVGIAAAGVAALARIILVSTYEIALADPLHCDRSGQPSCFDLGHQAAISGIPCPNGHSTIHCAAWNSASGNGGSVAGSSSSNKSSSTSNLIQGHSHVTIQNNG